MRDSPGRKRVSQHPNTLAFIRLWAAKSQDCSRVFLMARLWHYRDTVQHDEPSRPAILAQGKFFSRAGLKFFLKAMRLADVELPLDLNQRLVLKHRLQVLQETHTTALVLREEQADAVLDLATYSGLHALVEITVKPEDLLESARVRA